MPTQQEWQQAGGGGGGGAEVDPIYAAAGASDVELAAAIAAEAASRSAADATKVAKGELEFNIADYGAAPANTAAQNKTAIDNALAAADAAGGGRVFCPAGSYLTNGGHDVPPGVYVAGVRRNVTIFFNRAATYTFRCTDESSPSSGARLQDLSVIGSDGVLAAVDNALGVVIANGLRSEIDRVYIFGFTGANSIGLRFHNVDGTLEFVEQHQARAIVVNCTCLVEYRAEAGAGTSFGYNNTDLQLQAYANQTAIRVVGGAAGAGVYNGLLKATLHIDGDNVICLDVQDGALVWQGQRIAIYGEMLGAYAGCTRIKCAGVFVAKGTFYIANGQPPDDLTGAETFDFTEEPLTFAEFSGLGDLTIASAANLGRLPGTGKTFRVTGNTNITAIGGTWEGREVTLRFAAAGLTVVDGGNLDLAGGNFGPVSAGDTLTLTFRSGVWYEQARAEQRLAAGTQAARLAASPRQGLIWKETDTGLVYYGTGSAWAVLMNTASAVKTADETVNNSAALQNDDHLVLPVLANAVYRVEALLLVQTSDVSSDFKCDFAVPSGTLRWGITVGSATVSPWSGVGVGTVPIPLPAAADSVASGAGVTTGSTISGLLLSGLLSVGAGAGNLQFRWAQNAAQASDLKLLAGSALILTRLA